MQAEVDFLGQLHHPNLVKLIGYCIEDDQWLLVYEFMTRGSLENHLFKSEYSYFYFDFLQFILLNFYIVVFMLEINSNKLIFHSMCKIGLRTNLHYLIDEPSIRGLKSSNMVVVAKEKRVCVERKNYSLTLIPQ